MAIERGIGARGYLFTYDNRSTKCDVCHVSSSTCAVLHMYDAYDNVALL